MRCELNHTAHFVCVDTIYRQFGLQIYKVVTKDYLGRSGCSAMLRALPHSAPIVNSDHNEATVPVWTRS